MTLVSGDIKTYADIRGGSSWHGRQMKVRLSTTAIFGDLGGYFFRNVRDKTSNITWRLCYPWLSSKWLQNGWPRMTLSGCFMLKSVFGHQGCCALSFALARLSCYRCVLSLNDTYCSKSARLSVQLLTGNCWTRLFTYRDSTLVHHAATTSTTTTATAVAVDADDDSNNRVMLIDVLNSSMDTSVTR